MINNEMLKLEQEKSAVRELFEQGKNNESKTWKRKSFLFFIG